MTFEDISKKTINRNDSFEKKVMIKVVKRIDKDLNKSEDDVFLKMIQTLYEENKISKKDYDSIIEQQKALRFCKRLIVQMINETEKEELALEDDI